MPGTLCQFPCGALVAEESAASVSGGVAVRLEPDVSHSISSGTLYSFASVMEPFKLYNDASGGQDRLPCSNQPIPYR